MRIGIDCRLWNETGVGRYTRNLVKHLCTLDHSNDYVLFARSADLENIKDQISTLRLRSGQEIKNKWKMENGKWKIVRADIRWHSLEEQIKFPKILYREKLDLVHFPYFSVPVFYKKSFIITIHDLILHNFPTGEASTLPLPLYKTKLLGYKFVISKAAKNAKKIIVPTKSVKEEVIKTLKIPKEKIEVTYEGVDEGLKSKFKSQNSKVQFKSKKFFLYVGNAYPHKNLNRLINAFGKFKSDMKYKDIELVLVGRKDYFYKKLKEKVKDMNLEKSIIFYGLASDEELRGLYQNAIALVIPSLMEGFGLTALEAMNNKCLVLASDIQSLKEICGDAAIYFNPSDSEDITSKMSEFLDSNNMNRYSNLRERGYDRSKLFSWKKMTEETLKIYESSISL